MSAARTALRDCPAKLMAIRSRGMWKIAPLSALVAFVVATAARGGEWVNDQYGYALSVPASWNPIPNDAIQRATAAIAKPGVELPHFVAAFEPGEHQTAFTYPYIMIQVQSYPSGMNVGTISRAELDDMVAKITGMGADALKKGFSDDARKLVGNVSLDSPTVVTTPPGFMIGTKMSVGNQTIVGRSYCLFGKTNAVSLHFYAKESDWENRAPIVDGLIAGFRRTPNESIAIGNITLSTDGKRISTGFDWDRVVKMGLLGGIIGALVGVIGWLLGRKKTSY